MSKASSFSAMKQFLGYQDTQNNQNASQAAVMANTEADIGKQENYTTGISLAGTAAQQAQDGMPDALKEIKYALNDKGLELQFDQVLVTNVTVLKRSPTETSQITLQFHGELTHENAAAVWSRACLELA